jgi:hypothetical protein
MTKATININLNEAVTESQRMRILEFLLTGCPLTGAEAYEWFGTMKLSTRISEIVRDGWPIQSRTIVTKSGKRVSQYYL